MKYLLPIFVMMLLPLPGYSQPEPDMRKLVSRADLQYTKPCTRW